MAPGLERAKQYLKQAQDRYLELAGLLATAQAGAASWETVRACGRSLQANLDSAAADLAHLPTTARPEPDLNPLNPAG